jgi:hypothetical protein
MFVIRIKLATNARYLGLMLFMLPDPGTAQTPQDVRSITREWVNVEQAISREAGEAERTHILTTDRIAVLEAETNLLRAERSGNTDRGTRDERERIALVRQETEGAAQHTQLMAFLLSAETQVKNMRARLPRTLGENLAHLYQRLPEEADSTHRGIAERLQTITGILTNIQAFNDSISVTVEVKAINHHPAGEVTTLYLGLGQAYYLSASDAGYGYPGAQGWTWTSQPGLKASIARAIATAEGRAAKPAFVELPVTLSPGPTP